MSDLPTRKEIGQALEIIQHGRQTHVEWIDYLTNENPNFDTEQVGDAEHHRWYLTGYDPTIVLLEAYAEGRLVVRVEPDYAAALAELKRTYRTTSLWTLKPIAHRVVDAALGDTK